MVFDSVQVVVVLEGGSGAEVIEEVEGEVVEEEEGIEVPHSKHEVVVEEAEVTGVAVEEEGAVVAVGVE